MSDSPIDELARLHNEMMQAVNAVPMDESVYEEAVRQFENFASINTPVIVAERDVWIADRDTWFKRHQEQARQLDDLRTQLACACDKLNAWCRESGVQECVDPYTRLQLRETLDWLWATVNRKHHEQLAERDAEIERLRAALQAIIAHQDLVGGSMAAMSATRRIAAEALNQKETA